jgi:uncharacterized protein YeaO (DUF488 family)
MSNNDTEEERSFRERYAQELKVDQSTISRDIKVLKELSNNYVLLLLFDSLSHNTDMPISLSLKVFLTLPLDNHII